MTDAVVAIDKLLSGESQGEFVAGQAEDVVPLLPDQCIDLVFLDLPFNFGKDWLRFGERPADLSQDDLPPEEYERLCHAWMWQAVRVLTQRGSLYVMTAVQHLQMMLGILNRMAEFRTVIVWPNSSMPRRDVYTPAWQPILWYTRSDDFIYHHDADGELTKAALPWGRKPTGFCMTNVWSGIPFVSAGCMASPEAILLPGTKKKAHVAQMPVGLARRAILASTDPGMLVADFFVGSGTTAVAARQTGRRFFCSDADPRCIQISRERLDRMQPTSKPTSDDQGVTEEE